MTNSMTAISKLASSWSVLAAAFCSRYCASASCSVRGSSAGAAAEAGEGEEVLAAGSSVGAGLLVAEVEGEAAAGPLACGGEVGEGAEPAAAGCLQLALCVGQALRWQSWEQ